MQIMTKKSTIWYRFHFIDVVSGDSIIRATKKKQSYNKNQNPVIQN